MHAGPHHEFNNGRVRSEKPGHTQIIAFGICSSHSRFVKFLGLLHIWPIEILCTLANVTYHYIFYIIYRDPLASVYETLTLWKYLATFRPRLHMVVIVTWIGTCCLK